MTWSTDDGKHEGAAMAMFADGALGGTYGPGKKVEVSEYADGTRAAFEADVRSEDDVVGWRGWCSCGWRSPRSFTRVSVPELEDRGNKIAYEESPFPPQWVEDEVHAEWKAHIAPDVATGAVVAAACTAADAARRLDEAAVAARLAGASWDAIGRAAGIARQSAHERWAAAAATAERIGPDPVPALAQAWAAVDPFQRYVDDAPDGPTPVDELETEYLRDHDPYPEGTRVWAERLTWEWEPATIVERIGDDEWTVEFDDYGTAWRGHGELRPRTKESQQ